MKIRSLRLTPGDVAAHPISATPLRCAFFDVWPDSGSQDIRLGDSATQFGFAPYGGRPVVRAGISAYDLNQVYYKLTNAADSLCVVYGELD